MHFEVILVDKLLNPPTHHQNQVYSHRKHFENAFIFYQLNNLFGANRITITKRQTFFNTRKSIKTWHWHRQPVAVNKYLFRTRYGVAAYLLYTHVPSYAHTVCGVKKSTYVFKHTLYTGSHYVVGTHSVSLNAEHSNSKIHIAPVSNIVHLILIVEPMQESRVNYPHNSNRYIAIVWWRR